MGKDLYYKKTPTPSEEEFSGLHMTTWNLLSDIFKKEDREDLADKVLTRKDLDTLNAVFLTAKASNNKSLMEDMGELMVAINKHESITLFIQG